MHRKAIEFLSFIKSQLKDYFFDKRVLDVGSGDVNGNSRSLFENCNYEGNDVIQVKM